MTRAPGRDGIADKDPAVADTLSSDQDVSVSSEHSARVGGRAPRSIRPGDTLGRYEIGEELGEGGMATVFRARDKELRRDVAIKVLFPHLARRSDVVRRFHREARAAAGLEHANILRIYDVGGAEGEDPPYIVMEMIRGRTLLAEVEQRGPMLTEIVAGIGSLLAEALAAAHAAGIIHRDIKPANVLIAPGGRLLLADFGVARVETEDSLVTKTGALLGTPAYMSPEQASGDTATARSDLYSLGVTLYQLATGSLPYTGSAAKVMAQIASGALVTPMRKRPAVGPDLSRIIERLMATEPERRPPSAASVVAELRAIAGQGGLGDPTEELAAYFADPDGFVRARTPAIVTTIVAAAQLAIREAKLPRAMSLADRASALDPGDPRVIQLIETVAAGDRATRRRRLLAIGGLGLAVAGGGAVVAFNLRATEAPADAQLVAMADAGIAIDATVVAIDATEPPAADAALPDAPTPIARIRIDAGMPARLRDAAVTGAVTADASIPTSPADAAVIAVSADASSSASATIIVDNDVWCDVAIDGVAKGRARGKPIQVEPGHHTVTCTQPGLHEWSKAIDLAAGDTRTVAGAMLGTFDITVGSTGGAIIDGLPYSRGGTARLKAGRHKIRVGGAEKYISISGPCQIRDNPELDCF